MTGKDLEKVGVHEEVTERAELIVPQLVWWKEPNLLKLYLMMPILFLSATSNGYDGSLLNGLCVRRRIFFAFFFFTLDLLFF